MGSRFAASDAGNTWSYAVLHGGVRYRTTIQRTPPLGRLLAGLLPHFEVAVTVQSSSNDPGLIRVSLTTMPLGRYRSLEAALAASQDFIAGATSTRPADAWLRQELKAVDPREMPVRSYPLFDLALNLTMAAVGLASYGALARTRPVGAAPKAIAVLAGASAAILWGLVVNRAHFEWLSRWRRSMTHSD